MKRVGIGLLVLVGIVALAWIVVPRLVSKDMLRNRLEATLSARLGRSVEIGDVGFGLRPLPQIRATELRLGRAGGAASDQEISVRRLDLALALRPLFRREIEVVRATVDGLVVEVYLPEAARAGGDGSAGEPAGASSSGAARGDAGGADTGGAPGGAGSPGGDAGGRAGRTGGSGFVVRIESLVLTDAAIRVRRGEEEILALEQIHEDLVADVAVDGVVHYSGRTEIPVWKLTTPTGSFGHGLPVVLEKSLRFDPKEGQLRIESANLDLAGLPISLEGTASGLVSAQAPEDTSTSAGKPPASGPIPTLDITFSGGPSRIESIVGLLPSSWVSRTGGLRSSGEVEIHGTVHGPVGEGVEPDFSLDLTLTDGKFEGGDLPAAIESFAATLRVDPKSVLVESLSARAAGSTLWARGRIDGYREVPRVDLALDGNLDLALVTALQKRSVAGGTGTGGGAAAVPLPELSGTAEIQAVVRGTLPPGGDPAKTLEPVGTAILRNVNVRGIERPIEDLSGKAFVRGTELEVSGVTFRIGESDLEVDGKVADFWALDPRTFGEPGSTRSDLVVRSRLLDLDALAPPPGAGDRAAGGQGAAAGQDAAAGQNAAAGFEVFAAFLSRLDGPIDLGVEKLRVRQLDWTGVKGHGALDRGQVRVDALDLHVFGGLLSTTGTVDLRDPRKPLFDLALSAQQLEAARFFTDNPGLSKLSGLGGFIEGAVDLTAKAKGALDDTFQLDLRTLSSLGNLEMEGGRISGHPIQNALATYLGQSDLQNLPIHDWLQSFKVQNGRVEFEQLLVKAGDFSLSGSGWTSIDGQVRLDADLLVPANRTASLRAKLPKVAADVLFGKEGGPVLVPIKVSGPATKPAVQLDEGRLTDRARALAGQQLEAEKRKLQDKLQAEKDALQKKLEEEGKKRARDAIGGLLPGKSVADSSRTAPADSTAGKIEEEVKGLLQGIFKKR